MEKTIKSFITIGDVIEVEHYGQPAIYTVEKIELIPNSPHVRPIDFVILVTFSYNNGESSIECTIDHFKYIKHISHFRQPGIPLGTPLHLILN